ncbi:YegS/Rv2252/BmrU family lipid kinase [Alienimonas californiensis]|uniref:Lipid kinase YegS n=1 Tax=Alienimonas californiensis TaxID=2527989 RepID=A0A517PAL7_9PLAN|nr:YegS/Rv2252/BmrU family lipid kinase [Alienimonas californiensis]QDT16417.1 Lipid kinase YegS [Alienimonas californiensis]
MSIGPITLILNGRAAVDERLREAVGSLRNAGFQVDVRVCWEQGDPARYARQVAQAHAAHRRENPDAARNAVIAAAGGDGTLNEVAAALVECGGDGKTDESGPILAVVPYGTANDFATAAGLPVDDPPRCLLQIPDLSCHLADVGRLNGRPFLNAASAGYAARVTTEADPMVKKLLGGMAYWWTGLKNLSDTVGAEVAVTADDDRWHGRVLAVVVGNGRYAGGGIAVTPHARIDDGKLEVTIVPEVGIAGYKHLYDDLLAVGEGRDPTVLTVGRAETVTIEADEPIQVNLDGEPLTDRLLKFDVLHKAIRVLLPATSPLLSPPPQPDAGDARGAGNERDAGAGRG